MLSCFSSACGIHREDKTQVSIPTGHPTQSYRNLNDYGGNSATEERDEAYLQENRALDVRQNKIRCQNWSQVQNNTDPENIEKLSSFFSNFLPGYLIYADAGNTLLHASSLG